MSKIFTAVFFIASFLLRTEAQTVTGAQGEVFSMRVVKDQLSDPWELTYGPDNYLWITEAKTYTVCRINPSNGEKTVLLDLSGERNFPRYDKTSDDQDGGKPWPQGGLMGLALHPQLLTGKPYVYLSYLYRFDSANSVRDGNRPNFGGYFFATKIVRYDYNVRAQKLINPVSLCDTLAGSSDHNAGRMLIAPVDGKDFLFYTIGDLGAGQFDNGGRTNYAQEIGKYEGKILRFNTEQDNDNGTFDKWIPNDNPFTGSRQNAVWSFGHRNTQGLSYAVVGGTAKIYSSEHGPYGDDEINIIEKGKNYGHPLILGYNDNNYNGLAASVSDRTNLPGIWHTTYPLIVSENENAAAIGPANYRDPIKSLYPTSHSYLTEIFKRTKNSDPNKPTWKSEAPSSIDVYTSSAIPGWKNSLLIPTLKEGKLIRLKLNESGNGITGDTINYFKGPVRYRDIAISPDGTKLYLALDSSSTTSGPSEQHAKGNACKGCILEFAYISGGSAGNSKQQQKTITKEKVFAEKRLVTYKQKAAHPAR